MQDKLKIEEIAEGLKEKYQIEILTCKLDVQNKADVTEVIDGLPRSWKRIDILVNNAGLARGP